MPWSHPGSMQRLQQCMHVLPHVPVFMHSKSRSAESQVGVDSPSAGRGRDRTPAHTGEGICNSTDTGTFLSPARAGEGCKHEPEESSLSHRISQSDSLSQIILGQKIKKKIPQIFIIPRHLWLSHRWWYYKNKMCFQCCYLFQVLFLKEPCIPSLLHHLPQETF